MLKNIVTIAHCSAQQTAEDVVSSLGKVDVCYGPLSHRLQASTTIIFHPKLISLYMSKEVEIMKVLMDKK